MKTWTHVERRLERLHLPYRVQDETLVTAEGHPVAVSVQGARDFLASPGHPDSKRQQRCKQRSLTRYGARILKRDGVISTECRDMQKAYGRIIFLFQQEQRQQAAAVAKRLLGGRYAG